MSTRRPSRLGSIDALILGEAVRIIALRTATSIFWMSGRSPASRPLAALGIVRLDPALEEAGRHRQMGGLGVHPLQVHTGEPTLEDILADFGVDFSLFSPMFLIPGLSFFL